MTNTTINQTASRAVRRWKRAQLGVIAGLVAIGLVMLGRSPHAATGTLVPALYQTVLDANGNPVSGAKICTYLGGTSTPVATYTDVNLTVPASNPITADSAGRWSAYLTTGVSYKFVLQDATGTVNVCNGAIIRTIDTVAAVPGVANPTVAVNTADVRLTLTSGLPVTSADVTAATTVYVTPYRGNRIALYDGTQWNLRTATETAITVPATTASIYDVFAVDTLTVPTYETVAWTNDSTRATALTTQDGVLSKTGQLTRRFLGSFRTGTVSGQTEDSATKRYVCNNAQRVRRPLRRAETAASWVYSTSTVRQANGSATNQVDVLVCVADAALDLTLVVVNTITGNTQAAVGIGEDSTTVMSTSQIGGATWGAAGVSTQSTTATLRTLPAVGRHVYAWLEWAAGATTTWYGAPGVASAPAGTSNGLAGWIEG